MLYWYKSTNTDFTGTKVQILWQACGLPDTTGTQFTCFTGTKVQILTLLLLLPAGHRNLYRIRVLQVLQVLQVSGRARARERGRSRTCCRCCKCLLQVLHVSGRERARERERSGTRRLALRASASSSVSICTFVPVKQVNALLHLLALRASGSSSVSICTFVPVTPVNRVPASGGDVPDAAVKQHCSKAAVKQQ